MRLLLCLFLISLVSCQLKSDSSIGPEQTIAAFIDNSSVYADGCELHIIQATDSLSLQKNPVQYNPSARTLFLVKKAQLQLSNGQPVPLLLPISIRFQTTGKQVVVHCGWVSPTVSEIDVLAITKR
ncbi:hypothetical protein [Spirosoma aerophilum]